MSVIFKALRAIESREGGTYRPAAEIRVAEGATTVPPVPILLGIGILAVLGGAVVLGFTGIEEEPRARGLSYPVSESPSGSRSGYDSVIVADAAAVAAHDGGRIDDVVPASPEPRSDGASRTRAAAVATDEGGGSTLAGSAIDTRNPPARLVFQPAREKAGARVPSRASANSVASSSWQELRRASPVSAARLQPPAPASEPAPATPEPAVREALAADTGPAVRPSPVAAAAPRAAADVGVGGPLEDAGTGLDDTATLAAVTTEPVATPVALATPPPLARAAAAPAVVGDAAVTAPREEMIGRVSVTRVGDSQKMRLLNQRLANAIQLRDAGQISNILVAMQHVVGIDSVFMLKTRAFTQLALDGDAGLAMNLLQQVLARDPTDLDASINMAVAELKLGYREQARRRLHNLASAAPHDVRVETLLRSTR